MARKSGHRNLIFFLLFCLLKRKMQPLSLDETFTLGQSCFKTFFKRCACKQLAKKNYPIQVDHLELPSLGVKRSSLKSEKMRNVAKIFWLWMYMCATFKVLLFLSLWNANMYLKQRKNSVPCVVKNVHMFSTLPSANFFMQFEFTASEISAVLWLSFLRPATFRSEWTTLSVGLQINLCPHDFPLDDCIFGNLLPTHKRPSPGRYL